MPQATLSDACMRIITSCRANLDVLTTYGLTNEMLIAAEQDLLAYVNSLPGPRRVIASRKTATEGLSSLFKQADSTLAKIDALMDVAGFDNEKLLMEYKSVRIISNLRGKTLTPDQAPTSNP
jgi:hypothetical protein